MANEPRSELSLFDLINVVLRHRRLVLGLPVVVTLIVSVILLVLPRTYTSSTSFMPQSSKSQASNLAGLAAQFGVTVPTGEPGQSPQFYSTLLTSREILREAVETRYAFDVGAEHYQGTLVELFDARGATPAERLEAAMKILAKRITAKATTETGIIRFSVWSRWAPLSQQIAQRIMTSVNEFNLKRRQSQATAERRFVEGRVTEAKEELRAAENQLQAFLDRNRELRNSPLLVFQQNRLQQEVNLRQAVYTTLAQSFENARIDEVRNTPVTTIIEPPDQPAKPDRRGLLIKALLAFTLGLFLAIAIAFSRELLRKSRAEAPEEFERFDALRQEAFTELRQAWPGSRRGPRGEP